MGTLLSTIPVPKVPRYQRYLMIKLKNRFNFSTYENLPVRTIFSELFEICRMANMYEVPDLGRLLKSLLKGSVSRVLRWVLLYINQKLFLRPIVTSHKIFTFLKGQFTINKKQAGAPLYYDMVLSRQYWNRRKMGVSAILKFATASLSDMTEKYLSTILPVFLLVLWVHIAQMKAFSHSNMAETYYFCDIISLRGACCEFQYCKS